MSASANTTRSPRAASIPARTAAPLPPCGTVSSSSSPDPTSGRARTSATVPSVLPSSTTRTWISPGSASAPGRPSRSVLPAAVEVAEQLVQGRAQPRLLVVGGKDDREGRLSHGSVTGYGRGSAPGHATAGRRAARRRRTATQAGKPRRRPTGATSGSSRVAPGGGARGRRRGRREHAGRVDQRVRRQQQAEAHAPRGAPASTRGARPATNATRTGQGRPRRRPAAACQIARLRISPTLR